MPELDATVLCALHPILGSLGTRGGEALCPWVAVECCVRTTNINATRGAEQHEQHNCNCVYEVRAACEVPEGLLLRQPKAWSSPVDRMLYDGVPAAVPTDEDDARAEEPCVVRGLRGVTTEPSDEVSEVLSCCHEQTAGCC